MKKYSIVIGMALFSFACSAPEYLPRPQKLAYHVKGFYIEETKDGESNMLGEIIEVNTNEIKVLPVTKVGGIRTIPKSSIPNADIVISLTSNNPEGIATWAGLINLAPLGHGYFFIFSVPVNLAATIPVANNATKSTYRVRYPQDISWDEMKKFARFPQGIPENVKPEELK
ncbi:MAG: hypothetical protein DYG98_14995 [Haliscomenobacteraceae bacterium CHB4]|nr:hypothetical protein [Saprospiraceae bacterium]MCE7924351.1 hypothetical protein [Haliscomenobacteraceae bacterium CHB4]